MDFEKRTEKKYLRKENSTNYYTEKELIDNVIKKLEPRTIVNKDAITESIVFLNIPTKIKQGEFDNELTSIIQSFNGEVKFDGGIMWIKIKRPNNIIPYGAYGIFYLMMFLIYITYYFSGLSGLFLTMLEFSLTN